jgi:hypothetical protein
VACIKTAPRFLIPGLLAFATSGHLSAQLITHLSPETDRAFDAYVAAVESKMDWQAHVQASSAEVTIAPSMSKADTDVKGGVVHDWTAATIAPEATVEKVLAVLQDYDDYKRLYWPQVTDSKLLSHNGNHWRAYLKLYKKKVFTAVLDSEYDIEYRPLSDSRWALISRSTKVSEIDDGKPLPPGTGHGFLWRLNAYWIIEPRPQGVYLECRAISISRDIPFGLSFAIKPMLTTVPRDTLRETLEATIRALR